MARFEKYKKYLKIVISFLDKFTLIIKILDT